MDYKIYAIVDLRNDMPVYVGSTRMSLKKRFSNHCTIKTCTMYRFIKENGRENFKIVLLRKTETKAEALKLEEEYTRYFVDFIDLKNKDIGSKHSDEHNQKISESNKNKPKLKLRKKVICITTDEVFDSVKAAGKKYNIPSGNITFNCQNKRKSAGGYSWKYVA